MSSPCFPQVILFGVNLSSSAPLFLAANTAPRAGDDSDSLDSLVAAPQVTEWHVCQPDMLQTRNRSGQAAAAANFRSDANVDGVVNSGDTLVVRERCGASLGTAGDSAGNINFDNGFR